MEERIMETIFRLLQFISSCLFTVATAIYMARGIMAADGGVTVGFGLMLLLSILMTGICWGELRKGGLR